MSTSQLLAHKLCANIGVGQGSVSSSGQEDGKIGWVERWHSVGHLCWYLEVLPGGRPTHLPGHPGYPPRDPKKMVVMRMTSRSVRGILRGCTGAPKQSITVHLDYPRWVIVAVATECVCFFVHILPLCLFAHTLYSQDSTQGHGYHHNP